MIKPESILIYQLKSHHQRLRDFWELLQIYTNKKVFYFVSFPKSGRTWVRLFLNYYFFLCNPFSVTSRDDLSYYRTIPIINYTHGQYKNMDLKKIKANIRRMSNKQVIFMIRDPRDIFISYYFQLTKRKDPAKRFYAALDLPAIDWKSIPIGELLVHPYFGINWIIQHMNLWYGAVHRFKRSHLIQYEKIKINPEPEFRKIIHFIFPKRINQAALDKAIFETKFNKMKTNEKNRLYTDDQLSPQTWEDEDSYKVRRGKVGGYKDYLSEYEIQYINTAMNRLHPDLKKKFF